MAIDYRIKGRILARAPLKASATMGPGSHGWRLGVSGAQVVTANATVIFAMGAIVDTDDYWSSGAPTKVTIPGDLGGVYVIGADGFEPSYLAGLIFELIIESGDEEAAFNTSPPKGENPLAGFYRLEGNGVVHLKVTNTTGSPVTLTQGSFTGVLLLPDGLPGCLDIEYPFLDAVGSPAALEVIAGKNGTVGGDAAYNGTSLAVSGNSGSTFLSSSDDLLAPQDSGLICAWLSYPATLSATYRDWSGAGGTDPNGWILVSRRSGTELLNEIMYRVGGTEVRTGLSLSFLSTHLTHYALGWNRTESALYINGVRVYTGPGRGSVDIALPWTYGRNGSLAEYYPGRTADFRVYGCKLSDSQVKDIYAEGVVGRTA